jgi:hypothetical protein
VISYGVQPEPHVKVQPVQCCGVVFMNELEQLRKENQTLRALLATANGLLAKSKEILAKKSSYAVRKKTVKPLSKRRRKTG